MQIKAVLTGLCALALAGGCLVADVAGATPADAIYYGCSTYTYYPTWGSFNRQGLKNETSPRVLYFYQDNKVGSHGAGAGSSATGGKGYTYCGTNFFYSVDRNL
jgi:hypothetical protein